MLQRSPVIFWLLLGATLAGDALVTYWLIWGQNRFQLTYTLNVWSALMLAQVSGTAIWLVFRPRHDAWSWILSPVVLLAASFVRTKLGLFGPDWTTLDYTFRTALQGLISLVVLWLLMRTPMWRWLSPAATQLKWEFSLRQLLGWTTVTAVLSALVARSTWSDSQPISVSQTAGVFAPSTIAVSSVLLAASSFHWLARFSGYVFVGAAVGLTLNALLNWNITDRLLVEFVSEALIVAAWVEWGGIVPHVANVTGSQSSSSFP